MLQQYLFKSQMIEFIWVTIIKSGQVKLYAEKNFPLGVVSPCSDIKFATIYNTR